MFHSNSQNKVSPTPVRVAASPFASSRFALCLATRRALRPDPSLQMFGGQKKKLAATCRFRDLDILGRSFDTQFSSVFWVSRVPPAD